MSVRPSRLVALVATLGLAGCGPSAGERRADEGRRVLAAYDAAMATRGPERAAAVARLRAIEVDDAVATRAKESCVTLLESLAAASELQARLEPMAARLEELARSDASVPPGERSEAIELYALATRSADVAAAAIDPCTRAMDALRTASVGSH